MKKIVQSLLLTGLVASPMLAQAAEPVSPHTLTGNIALTSDYVFRGISQTQNGPAIQGGFDYAHASGFYLGTWGSNVDWVSQGYKTNNSMEIDLYGGYKTTLGPIGLDLGVITYYFPGDKIPGVASPDTTEVYVGGSWKFLSLKYSHVVSKNFIGWVGTGGADTRNSQYLELNANYDLGSGWGLIGHVGHQKVKNLGGADYTDWKAGVSKDVGFGVLTVAYTDTDADSAFYTLGGEDIGKGRAFVSFSKTF